MAAELVIIDYGVGNQTSIKNILRRAQVDATISSDPAEVAAATHLILPGVGAFDYGAQRLREAGLEPILNRRVLEDGVPILGICLGAQLMAKQSEEGSELGLGWFDATVRRFDTARLGAHLKVPHMGWAEVNVVQVEPLFVGMFDSPRFYFVHSFHLQCANDEDVLATAQHGYEYIAAVQRDNMIGVQFHPEKSHKYGKRLLEQFARWEPAS